MIRVFPKIPGTIKAVGLASFFINTSTLMVFSLFGIYLHDKLNIDFYKIGFLDGAVESFSYLIKIFSGIISDVLMNRKYLFLAGTFCMLLAKPLEALATSYWPLFQAKILERTGNGLQATPRDAIVGDWAPENIKATCFGFRQSLAALGAVVGSILAAVILKKTNGNYQLVFWMAAIPSVIAATLIMVFVKEKKFKRKAATSKKYRWVTINDIKNLGSEYWMLICVACTYMVSKVTESIVIIYVISSLGLPKYIAPICMIAYQIANSFISLPAGVLSDKLKSRETIFILGIIVFILSDLLFIFGNGIITFVVALLFLGAYIGISQSIFPAKIIDIVPKDLKGTGIGIFNLACAVSFLIGGSITGYISEQFSIRHAFVISSGLAVFSLVVLLISKNYCRKKLEKDV